MTARIVMIAAALSLSTGAFAADPAKPDARNAQASAPAAARELVLASAEVKSPPSSADPQLAAPVKRRTARVTTCRCGDPQLQNEQQ